MFKRAFAWADSFACNAQRWKVMLFTFLVLAAKNAFVIVSNSIACAHGGIYIRATAVHTFSFIMNAERLLSELLTSSVLTLEFTEIAVRVFVTTAERFPFA